MIELEKIPIYYRLAAVFAAGVLLGHIANLLAYGLSMRPGRNPWSRLHPYDGRGRWLDRLPLVGWLRLARKSETLGRGFWISPLLAELLMGAFCAALYGWQVGTGALLPPGAVAVGGKIPPSPITWQIMYAVFGAQIVLS
ncbi:MAG: hypothetical protein B7Z73_09765, partial [Planctomycetia bacterium 21-64-5]